MRGSRPGRVAGRLLLWAMVLGSSIAQAPPEASLPDPLRSGESPWGAVLFLLGFSIMILGALWMAHMQSRREDTEAEPEGPVLMVDTDGERKGGAPEFYDEIKQRENTLDEQGSGTEGRGPALVKDITPDSSREDA